MGRVLLGALLAVVFYTGFVSQLKAGTPWMLVNGSEVIAEGEAGR